MEQGSFNRFEEYTTDERVCGVWIDGSKIYRKTILIDGEPEQGTACFDTGIDDIDKIIKFENVRYWDDGESGASSWSQLKIPSFVTNLNNQLAPYNSYRVSIEWQEVSTDVWRPHICIQTYVQGNSLPRDNTLNMKWHSIVTLYYTKTSS